MRKRIFLLPLLFLSTIVFTHAQTKFAASRAWYDNKYSMFIHFGVYSELGGVWKNKPIENGYSEQIQAHAGIMADIYEEIPSRFNPINWNAGKIASLAKKAGMRSIVITSKHHDGFCMYKSAFTRFNVVDASPFKRDILKELSEACKNADLNFGLYFSLIDYTLHPFTSHNANPITADHHAYNKNQVTELLTNYGPISELWFDMGSLTAQQSRELYDLVHKLQPACLVSGRLGNNSYDFCVMGDNEYPDFKIDSPWQTPASMFDETWGYRSWQKRENTTAKIREKLFSLIKVVSRGGNYLLNIGPKGDGSVVPYEAEVLLGIGSWLEKNGDAIYGTSCNPFPESFSWGDITTKGNYLYLILSGKAVNSITLPGISGSIKEISTLNNPTTVIKSKYKKEGLTVTFPDTLYQKPEIQVIVIEFKNKFQLKPEQLVSGKSISLDFHNAIKHYSYSCIDYYNNFRSIVRQSWNFSNNQKAAIPVIYFTNEEIGKEIELNWNGKKEYVSLNDGEKIPVSEKLEKPIWENRYSYGPVRSDFENIPGTIPVEINPSSTWLRDNHLKWNFISKWENGTEESMISLPIQYLFILHEITSGSAQNQLVEIGSGDGIQVWLNGENIIKHNNVRGSCMNKEIVLLSLKSGKNQLLIKFYNRYSYLLNYSINKNISQTVYKQTLSPQNFSGINTCELKMYNPESEHQPIRMNNIKIQL